jgi:hypothetical protein
MKIFEKNYDGFESWTDIERDIFEMWNLPNMRNITEKIVKKKLYKIKNIE